VNVLVCVKRVPAPGARINLTADEQAIDTAHLGFTTSPHEECAVEAAVQLVETHGGAATVLTVGPAEAEEQLRYAVSVGMSAAVLIPTDGTDWDPQRTARAITEAVTRLEAADGRFDLLLFGNEAADSGGFQVGIRVAHALGRPIVNGIKGIEVVDGAARLRRDTDTGQETYELPLPAAVGVKEGINLPRYPTMKGRLASKRVEIARLDVAAESGGQQMVRLQRPVERAASTVILGHGAGAAAAVVDLLDELGVLP
jgi:electron transfer flavoprotein beta subunit